jgi:hypothetical protein
MIILLFLRANYSQVVNKMYIFVSRVSVFLFLSRANLIKKLTACVCLSVCQLSKRYNEVEFF